MITSAKDRFIGNPFVHALDNPSRNLASPGSDDRNSWAELCLPYCFWHCYRPTIKDALWLAAVDLVLVVVIGQYAA